MIRFALALQKITDEDAEMAADFLSLHPEPSHLDIGRLIAEVRTEQRDLDAAICDDYAEVTTYVRKATAAKECGKRIRSGPATGAALSKRVAQEKP